MTIRPPYVPLNALVTGSTGGGKSHYAAGLIAAWAPPPAGLVIIDRSDQHRPWVDVRVLLDRVTAGHAWDWRRVLREHSRLLVQVEADPALAWPELDRLGHALYELGDRRLVLEEAQRWTPPVGGSRGLALLATDGRKRGLDWAVIAPELTGRQGGIAPEWIRESNLRIAFPTDDPRQAEVLSDLVPAWGPHVRALRHLRRNGATVTPGELLVWDRRQRIGARIDAATGRVVVSLS